MLRIAEDRAGDVILFAIFRGSLRFALSDDDEINPRSLIVGIFVFES